MTAVLSTWLRFRSAGRRFSGQVALYLPQVRWSHGKAPIVKVPEHELQIAFTRASGPGGQNVNKVNTRVEVRLHIQSAEWLDPEVRARLLEQQSTRVNQRGELLVTAQEHRTQRQNRTACLAKLQDMVNKACVKPRERNRWEGISDLGKDRRKSDKRKRSQIKENRRRGRGGDIF